MASCRRVAIPASLDAGRSDRSNFLNSACVPPQIGGSATLSVTGNCHCPGGDGGTVFQRGSVSQPYRGKSLNLRTGKSTVRSAYSPKWRQLCNAIAAPSTDALKRSSWYRTRVTQSARSAELPSNRGWKAPTFPNTNSSNVLESRNDTSPVRLIWFRQKANIESSGASQDQGAHFVITARSRGSYR